MQPATPATVLADFGGTTFEHLGVTTRFDRRGDRFYVTTEGGDGKPHEYEVLWTYGVRPLQQYLVRFEDGRIQCLTIAWDTVEHRWFPLYDERMAPTDPLHWTGLQQNWNFMCAECHSTDVRRNFDLASNTFHTTWQDVTIGCQACHGPGSTHVAWAERAEKAGRVASVERDGDPGLDVRWNGADSRRAVDGCARCHARRSMITEDYRTGRPFLDHHEPALLVAPLYHADGQIRDEVYEYGSFLQSRMYAEGVRCTDCHDAHSIRLRERGNAMCTTCHQSNPPVKFRTLKKKLYDGVDHHKHEAGKPGSLCVDCHMPVKKYMVVDPRRDHSFRIPRPDLSEATGAPDACTACHQDKTTSWAAEKAKAWWPPEEEAAAKPAPFGPTFAAAQRNDPSSAPALASIALDPKRPGIVRATALFLLRRFPSPESRAAYVRALRDAEGLVRLEAVRGLSGETMPLVDEADGRDRAQHVAERLADDLRVVRMEAAGVLVALPPAFVEARWRAALDAAIAEFVARQTLLAERPESHLNLARLAEHQGRPVDAESEYRTALRLDPTFQPARFNLANLLDALGRPAEAEPVLREVVRREPGNGEGWYSLGLVLGELRKYDEAAAALSTAAPLLGARRPRALYNLGQVLDAAGRPDEAEDALLRAHQALRDDPEILEALATAYARHGKEAEALDAAERLVRLAPTSSRARALYDGLRAAKR